MKIYVSDDHSCHPPTPNLAVDLRINLTNSDQHCLSQISGIGALIKDQV